MLRERDLRLWVDRLGVPEQQVRRDHLVSAVLLAVPDILPEAVFFGGTALCRTHLPHWRLSEDIDLLVGSLGSARDEIGERLPQALRREYPELELSWLRLDGTEVARGLTIFEGKHHEAADHHRVGATSTACR